MRLHERAKAWLQKMGPAGDSAECVRDLAAEFGEVEMDAWTRALAEGREAGWNAAIDEAAGLFEDTDWLDEPACPGESFPRCARMVRALRTKKPEVVQDPPFDTAVDEAVRTGLVTDGEAFRRYLQRAWRIGLSDLPRQRRERAKP